jgi:hypothetical protein
MPADLVIFALFWGFVFLVVLANIEYWGRRKK